MAAYAGAPQLSLRDCLDRRWTAMKTERTSWDTHVRDVFDHTRPRRTRFQQTQTNKGDRRNQGIIDNTGVIASNVLMSGMVNGMSSPAQPWFRYEPEDLALMEYGPAKEWIGQLERLVRRIFHASNTYEALPSIYEELILAGTGAGVVEDDFEDVIRTATFTWGEYALALNGRRVVDTLYREMRMTVIQCVQQFGLKNVSTTVRSLYDTGQYDQWVDVMHAIEPNMERDHAKADAPNMPYRSIYWEPHCKGDDLHKFLRKSGYRQCPIIAPRWSVIGNDVYGHSPGMDALGDMRQLQVQQKRKGQAIEKQVNPPTQGPASLADSFIKHLPGQHNTVTDPTGKGIRSLYDVRPDLQWMVADIEDTRRRVEEAFFVPYILAISRMEGVQPKNQMELQERKGEGLLVLGPVVQRLQNELHAPLHERVINRIVEVCLPLWRAGEPAMLPPPPPELEGVPLQVQYISSLAQVQKAVGVSNIERVLMLATNPAMMQAFPDMLDKIDGEQVIDELADQLGLPNKMIRSDDKVEAIKQQRAEQQQMQQAAAAAPAMKDMAGAAKALSETNVGGGKGALQAMLEGAMPAGEEGAPV